MDLGLDMQSLRSMTFRRFCGMVDRLKAMDRPRNGTIELMVAQVAAVVANTGFRSFKRQKEPADFMPSEWEKKMQPMRFPKMTPQQIARKMKDLMAPHRAK